MFDQRHMQSAYLYLVQCACEGRTTNIEELTQACKYGTHEQTVAIDPIVSAIGVWAESKGQPPLTALIVRASGGSKGIPPVSFWRTFGVVGDITDEAVRRFAHMLQNRCFHYYRGTGVNNPAVRKRVSKGLKILRIYKDDQTLYNQLINMDMRPYALGTHTKPKYTLGTTTQRNVNLDAAIDSWLQANLGGYEPNETLSHVVVSVRDTFNLKHQLPKNTRITSITRIAATSDKDIELPTYGLVLTSNFDAENIIQYDITRNGGVVGEIVLDTKALTVTVSFSTRGAGGGLVNNEPLVTGALLTLFTYEM